ncbi:MAG: hypothetical protein LUD72_01050 [Bacteroidales bacterium]|nr:hypothetical protein [Bacteroidales bacterium]
MTRENIRSVTTRAPFRLPLTPSEMSGLLTEAYRAQVIERRRFYRAGHGTEEKIGKVSEWLTSGTLRPMLMLQGSVGNGKTTMLRAISRTLANLKRSIETVRKGTEYGTMSVSAEDAETVVGLRRTLQGTLIFYISATEMVRRIAQDPNRAEGYSGCDLLLIDDWGRETVTAKHFGSDLFPIVDVLCRRYDTMSPTIVTTNLTDADISAIYGERVADRFREVFDRISYTEDSFR